MNIKTLINSLPDANIISANGWSILKFATKEELSLTAIEVIKGDYKISIMYDKYMKPMYYRITDIDMNQFGKRNDDPDFETHISNLEKHIVETAEHIRNCVLSYIPLSKT